MKFNFYLLSIVSFSPSGEVSLNAKNLLTGLTQQLNGPLPIPTFDQYVYVAQYLTSYVKKPTNAMLARQLALTTEGQQFGNLLNFGSLHFAPYPSVLVDSLVNYLNASTRTFKKVGVLFHATEADAVSYILDNLVQSTFALIVVNDITPTAIDYTIRQNFTVVPSTNTIVATNILGLDTDYQMYYSSGFLTLENTIDQWALNYAVQQVDPAATCAVPQTIGAPFPAYAYTVNPFYTQIGFLLGLALTMSTLYPVSRLVKNIVEEKETVSLYVAFITLFMFLFRFSFRLVFISIR